MVARRDDRGAQARRGAGRGRRGGRGRRPAGAAAPAEAPRVRRPLSAPATENRRRPGRSAARKQPGSAGTGRCRTHAMQETVASALAQLARLDPRAARLAENALASITGGSSLQDLTQRAVQEFCWYVLPVRFGGETGERMLTAQSLGRLFSLLDLDRYAAICSSATTRAVLDAHSGGYDSGLAAYQRAMRASGVEPPDLPELTWGASLGSAEIEASRAVSAALELAIAAGDVRPGTRGWRSEQERFTHALLTQPDPQGRSRLDRIREERARGWLGSPSHPHRQRLWPLLGRLIGGAEVPQDAAEALAPVRRLLDFADEGIGLTQIGYISPSVVRELCAEFDWAT